METSFVAEVSYWGYFSVNFDVYTSKFEQVDSLWVFII